MILKINLKIQPERHSCNVLRKSRMKETKEPSCLNLILKDWEKVTKGERQYVLNIIKGEIAIQYIQQTNKQQYDNIYNIHIQYIQNVLNILEGVIA